MSNQTSPWAGVPYGPDVTLSDLAAQQQQGAPVQVFAPGQRMSDGTTAAPEDAGPAPMPSRIGTMQDYLDRTGGDPKKATMLAAQDPMRDSVSPFVSDAPRASVSRERTPIEQQADVADSRLKKLQWQDANPYGSPDNHPGVGGKILHALSVAGNIAGDIFAPSTMELIPGTQLNRQMQEQGLGKRLQGLTQAASEDNQRDEQTAEMPAKAAGEQESSSARTRLANDQAQEIENAPDPEPSLAQAYAHAVSDALKNGGDPGTDPVVAHIRDAITQLQKQPAGKLEHLNVQGAGGKPMVANYNPDSGETTDAAGNVIPNPVPYEKPQTVNVNAGKAQERAAKNDVLKAYQPTQDSAERMNVMTESYEKAVKDHDQQAMLNLLANHLGMTMGLQKGARITKDIVNEAKQSQPWLQGIASKFDKDGYLTGVTLSPNQMRQMVALGRSRYAEDAKKSRSTAQYLGATDDGPERVPSSSTMRFYLGQTGGDAAKAKALAAQDGWSVK